MIGEDPDTAAAGSAARAGRAKAARTTAAAAAAAAAGSRCCAPELLQRDAEVSAAQFAIQKHTRLLELEKRRLRDLSDASLRAQAEYEDKRSRYAFNKPNIRKEFHQAEQQIHLLEDRVAFAASKHNTEISFAAELRLAIDKQRKERLSLEQAHLLLTKEAAAQQSELHAIKQQIAELQQQEQQALQTKRKLYQERDKERAEFKQTLEKKQQVLKQHVRKNKYKHKLQQQQQQN